MLSGIVLLSLLALCGAISWNADVGNRELMYAFGAYCPIQSLQDWDCYYCKSVNAVMVASDDSKECFSYVGVSEENREIFVSFRGTTSATNWLADLDIKFKEVGNTFGHDTRDIKVHSGFYETFDALKDNLIGVIENLTSVYPDYAMVVTGHSLGGAQATLMTLYLNTMLNITNIYSYTFGSPRVGNKHFANIYNERLADRTFRVTHSNDIVVHNPPQGVGYQHVATEIYTNEDYTKTTVCDSSGEDPKCADKYKLNLKVDDHLIYLGVKDDLCGDTDVAHETS